MLDGNVSYLLGHVKDLALESERGDYLTSTAFLGFSERARLLKELSVSGGLPSKPFGRNCLFYGGYPEAERTSLIFLPSYYGEESFLEAENQSQILFSCLRIYPKSEKFATPMGHRDYLGALLSLGIERERIGDILFGEKEAYVYVLKENADYIRENLTSVGRNPVKVEEAKPLGCPYRPRFEEKRVPVSSLRLDCLLAAAFHISREEAKRQILAGNVTLTSTSPASDASLNLGEHVSLKGKGKFVFLGEDGQSKKGKVIALIKLAK